MASASARTLSQSVRRIKPGALFLITISLTDSDEYSRSDLLAAIESEVISFCVVLESSSVNSQTYQEINNLIHEVELLWVKGHIGIVGNETVDTFPKLGCTLCESLDHKLSPIDLAHFALKPFIQNSKDTLLKLTRATSLKPCNLVLQKKIGLMA
ncbi:hypothetical protein Trydic_g13381 [Trypoxylus dichotomus]